MQFLRNKPYFALLSILFVATTFSSVIASTPSAMNYQGYLTDSGGKPIDGNFNLTFSIYSEENGGTLFWQETQNVDVSDGLFAVILGDNTPLTSAVFTTEKVYLGIAVDSDPEMSPRQRITTAAFSHRVTTIDGAQGGSVSGDVEVLGNFTNGNYAFLNQLRLGSPSLSGKLDLFQDGSSNPIAELQPHPTAGGGEFRIYDPSHGQSVYASHDVSAGGGGFLSVYRNAASTVGFVVDGNYNGTTSPRVIIQDANRAMIFDTGVDGDSAVMLPYGTINSIETANEAGVSEAAEYIDLTLDDTFSTPQTLISQSIDCPRSGYVLALGSASVYFHNSSGIWADVDFGLSTNSSILQTYKYTYRHHSPIATGEEQIPITIHRVFQVSEGQKVINFLAKTQGLIDVTILNAQISLIYLPTWYGPRTPGAQDSQQDIDQLVDERVKEETARLEKQFERRLREVETAIQEQQGATD